MASSLSANHNVAVVTGSSSGIGFETSLKEKLPLKIVQLDVTDDGSVKIATQSIIVEAGRIDVLVNNAGYSLNGALKTSQWKS